jgi:hypothetical protein
MEGKGRRRKEGEGRKVKGGARRKVKEGRRRKEGSKNIERTFYSICMRLQRTAKKNGRWRG